MYSDMLVILDYSTGEVDIIRIDLKDETMDDDYQQEWKSDMTTEYYMTN